MPGLDVTAKPVMGLPRFEAGAVKPTVAWALPAFTPTIVGALGSVACLTLFEKIFTRLCMR